MMKLWHIYQKLISVSGARLHTKLELNRNILPIEIAQRPSDPQAGIFMNNLFSVTETMKRGQGGTVCMTKHIKI